MNQDIFKQYQNLLNIERVNKLNSTPKLSPRPLVFDEDFDVSIDSVPIKIKIPEPPKINQVEPKPVSGKENSTPLW